MKEFLSGCVVRAEIQRERDRDQFGDVDYALNYLRSQIPRGQENDPRYRDINRQIDALIEYKLSVERAKPLIFLLRDGKVQIV